MFATGVKCDYCNGFVVTPSGRAITKVEMTAGVYVIYGGTKVAWIGAKNKTQALEHFTETIEDYYLTVVKLKDQEMMDTEFLHDPVGNRDEKDYVRINAKDSLIISEQLPFTLYAVEVDDLMAAKRAREEEEGES